MKKIIISAMCLMMMLFGAVCSAASFSDMVDTDMNGNNVIRVIGTGVAPQGSQFSAPQKKMMARQAAITHGYGELAAAIKGLHVDAENTVENFVLTNSRVTTKVSALVRGAKVVEEKEQDGAYIVVLEIPMYGSGSVAEAVIPEITSPVPQAPAVAPQPTQQVYGRGGYTGLVIDCRGFDVSPAMCPLVKSTNGRTIYGYQITDSATLINGGTANYIHSDTAVNRRAGSNPLVIRALSVENHSVNPVVSDADADLIIAENGLAHFLERGAVTILR